MIHLIRYQLALHLRMFSTAVILAFILLCAWIVRSNAGSENAQDIIIMLGSQLTFWVTLMYFFQLTSYHSFFFRAEALQYRLARIRNRSTVMLATFAHVAILAAVITLPYVVLYGGLLNTSTAMMSIANMFLFNLYIGIASILILGFIGTGATSTIILLLLLFFLPLGTGAILALKPALAANPVVSFLSSLIQSHLDVSGNPDMLILRGIQDTDALLRTLILTPILATITYVRFLRADHH